MKLPRRLPANAFCRKIYPTRGAPNLPEEHAKLYYWLYVFATHAEFAEWAATLDIETVTEDGVTDALTIFDFDGGAPGCNRLGLLVFHTNMMFPELIAHEATHAAIHYVCGTQPRFRVNRRDETLAYTVGIITKQIVNATYKLG